MPDFLPPHDTKPRTSGQGTKIVKRQVISPMPLATPTQQVIMRHNQADTSKDLIYSSMSRLQKQMNKKYLSPVMVKPVKMGHKPTVWKCCVFNITFKNSNNSMNIKVKFTPHISVLEQD